MPAILPLDWHPVLPPVPIFQIDVKGNIVCQSSAGVVNAPQKAAAETADDGSPLPQRVPRRKSVTPRSVLDVDEEASTPGLCCGEDPAGAELEDWVGTLR
jgi:hypothetical protein